MAMVETLDLTRFSETIKAREGVAGRDATDPRLLVGLWLYGRIRGIGSARELARRSEESAAFRWLCGVDSSSAGIDLVGHREERVQLLVLQRGTTMFTPPSFTVALLMTVASAVCWGSWANTYKGVKNYRFELFYWDYAVGIFLISLVGALTLGSTGHDSTSFLNNVHSADSSNILWTMVGGAIFNLANLLLVAAIDMAGLAVALPVSIGIALVVGTMLSYILQPKGNLLFIAIGVACALIAVILDGKAFGSLPGGRTASRKSIVICVVSGVLMGLWNPFVAYGATRGNALSPYSSVVFLTLGALLSCFIWNLYFMKKPLAGEPVGIGGFFTAPASGHLLGLLGGIIWGLGTMCNVVAGASPVLSFALSYAIGQSAPMVGALWGVFAWKEFAGAGPKAKMFLTLMFVFYGLAILLLAHASG